MIGWILKHIAGLLRSIANLCDPPPPVLPVLVPRPFVDVLVPGQSNLPFVDNSLNVSDEVKDPKRRLKALLAMDDLTPDEAKELAALASQIDGNVIFLDDPVGAEKEHL